ncbi:hypothetical protein AVEN_40240-1 [Araneus ventricosus]|uniref:Uncharacterized protein n=1 Tax=Araneus ventricosus TaxID=182803 RepID=A0A4Y2JD33_ARAVE|nr:hypothetical protein AVEN_40240-1 [Araneus ventricosus]
MIPTTNPVNAIVFVREPWVSDLSTSNAFLKERVMLKARGSLSHIRVTQTQEGLKISKWMPGLRVAVTDLTVNFTILSNDRVNMTVFVRGQG